MAMFRRRPIVVEAIQITDRMRTGIENIPIGIQHNYAGGGMFINTPDGIVPVEVGDWIIVGEQYPCKPDIFAAKYIPV